MSFADFSGEQQAEITRKKICYEAVRAGGYEITQEMINFIFDKNFNTWLGKVRSVDPLTVKIEDREKLVNELFNDEGRFYLYLVTNGFFETWDPIGRVPLLALTQPQYNNTVGTDWRIDIELNTPRDYILSPQMEECLQQFSEHTVEKLKERFKYLLWTDSESQEYRYIFGNFIYFIFNTHFQAWIERIKQIDPTKLKKEDVQPLLDEIFNPLGRYFYSMLSTAFGGYLGYYVKIPFFWMIEYQTAKKIDTDWWISHDYSWGWKVVSK